MTPSDLDDLAERMILPACRLVSDVQARDVEAVHARLSLLDGIELRALCVVLAELVPADDPALDLFTTWTHQDAERRPPVPVTGEQAAANRRALAAAIGVSDGYQPKTESGVPIKHGTPGGYSNRDCRCDACTAANTSYQRQRRAKLKAEVAS